MFRYLEVGCLMRKLIVLNTLTDQEKERNKKRLWEAAELKKSHTTVPYPPAPARSTLRTPHPRD